LTLIQPGFRVGILTDQFLNTPRDTHRATTQPSARRTFFPGGGSTPDLAHLLRKHSSDEARSTGSKPNHQQEHAMIAATAFAVVGLVVIAFLNRIP
jgi:hypothetical protein